MALSTLKLPLFWQFNKTRVVAAIVHDGDTPGCPIIIVHDGDTPGCPIIIEDVKTEYCWQPQPSWTMLQASERATRLGKVVFINPPHEMKEFFWLGRLLGLYDETAFVRWFHLVTPTWYMEKQQEDKIPVDSIYWDIFPVLSHCGKITQVTNIDQIVNKINS
jgi:hypothetical protein